MTEINDYLKLLWPRIAHAFCPSCGREIRPETAKSIADQIVHLPRGGDPRRVNRPYLEEERTVLITFWVAVPAKTPNRANFSNFSSNKVICAFGSTTKSCASIPTRKIKRLGARVQVIQDRITISEENRARLVEAIETALRFGKGKVNAFELPSSLMASWGRSSSTLNSQEFLSPPAGIARIAISIFARRRRGFSVSTIRSARVRNAAALAAPLRSI